MSADCQESSSVYEVPRFQCLVVLSYTIARRCIERRGVTSDRDRCRQPMLIIQSQSVAAFFSLLRGTRPRSKTAIDEKRKRKVTQTITSEPRTEATNTNYTIPSDRIPSPVFSPFVHSRENYHVLSCLRRQTAEVSSRHQRRRKSEIGLIHPVYSFYGKSNSQSQPHLTLFVICHAPPSVGPFT